MSFAKYMLFERFVRFLCLVYFLAVAIDTNLLVALRATNLLLTPIKSRDHILITLQYR